LPERVLKKEGEIKEEKKPLQPPQKGGFLI